MGNEAPVFDSAVFNIDIFSTELSGEQFTVEVQGVFVGDRSVQVTWVGDRSVQGNWVGDRSVQVTWVGDREINNIWRRA